MQLDRGELADAEAQLRRELARATDRLGAKDPLTLRLTHNLAAALQLQSKPSEALSLYRQAFEGRRERLGKDDRETLISMNSLGALLRNQKQFDEAESILREALALRRKKFGSLNEDTVNSAGDLGSLLRQQGKYAEAEPLLREALEWRLKNLGAGHPYTLDSLYNMGLLLQKTGRLNEAEPLFKELYRYAPDAQIPPPRAAVYMSCHGIALAEMGRYREAEAPLLKAQRRLEDANLKNHSAYTDVMAALQKTSKALGHAPPTSGQGVSPATNSG